MYLRLRSDCRMLMTDIKRSQERQVYSLQHRKSLTSAILLKVATHVPRVAATPLIALPAGPFLDRVQSPPASMWRLPRPPLHH
jgi:hypothetical protein